MDEGFSTSIEEIQRTIYMFIRLVTEYCRFCEILITLYMLFISLLFLCNAQPEPVRTLLKLWEEDELIDRQLIYLITCVFDSLPLTVHSWKQKKFPRRMVIQDSNRNMSQETLSKGARSSIGCSCHGRPARHSGQANRI